MSAAQRPATGTLSADVRVRRGGFRLDVALHADPGEVVAVIGANGTGKSTLLSVLAGRVLPDEGRVRVGDRTLTEVVAVAGRERGRVAVAVRPERRSVGLLAQDALVFPHLSVRENVAFGIRAAGGPRAAALRASDEWLTAVGLEGFGGRRPDALSGGQRQRVALARALAAQPSALLLDEPLSQLDVQTAVELRRLVRDQVRRTGTATVLVTHDVLDALTLADRLLVLHDGRVVEHGPPLDVLGAPVHPFTAALAGVNLVTGTVRRGGSSGAVLVGPDGVRVACAPDGLADGASAQVTFPPTAVDVRPVQAVAGVADVSPAQTAGWDAEVLAVEPGATGLRLRTSGDVLVDLPPALVAGMRLTVGSRVRLRVPAEHVRVRPRA